VAGRKVLPGLANGLRCLHSSTQIAALQTNDVGLSLIDVSPQCCGLERGTMLFQPDHLANHLVPQIAQCPDQYRRLCCITFPHRGSVSAGSRQRIPPPRVRIVRTVGRWNHDPSAIGFDEIAHKVVRELIAPISQPRRSASALSDRPFRPHIRACGASLGSPRMSGRAFRRALPV
jgi:hypothetical protein